MVEHAVGARRSRQRPAVAERPEIVHRDERALVEILRGDIDDIHRAKHGGDVEVLSDRDRGRKEGVDLPAIGARAVLVCDLDTARVDRLRAQRLAVLRLA
ncbi:MAG: hypothetical protein ACK56F_21650, partial [bacterium]